MSPRGAVSGSLRIFILLFFIVGIASAISFYLFDFLNIQTDSEGYINAIKSMSANEALPDRLHRLVKPLSLFFAVLLSSFLGLAAQTALQIQQWLCYLATAFLFFGILQKLFPQDKNLPFVGLLLLLGSQVFAIYGLALMVDAAAWAIELWAIYLMLYLKTADNGLFDKKFLILGLLLGLGFFVKETIFMAGLYIFISILLEKSSFKSKLWAYTQIGTIFGLLVLMGSVATQYLYGKSMLTWWQFAHSDSEMYQLAIPAYLLQVFRTLDLFWFLTIIGIGLALKHLMTGLLSKELAAMLLVGLIGFILFPYLWAYRTDRILFMIGLFFLPFAAMGAAFFGHVQFLLILCGAAMNLFMTYRIYRFEEAGWISFLSVCFLGLLLLAVVLKPFFKIGFRSADSKNIYQN